MGYPDQVQRWPPHKCAVLYGNLPGTHQKDRYTARKTHNGGGHYVDSINCWGHRPGLYGQCITPVVPVYKKLSCKEYINGIDVNMVICLKYV